MRAIHVLASVGWLGLVVVMLVLSLAALAGDGGTTPILAIATLATGVALSIATPWGLIRRWWGKITPLPAFSGLNGVIRGGKPR